MSGFSLLEIWDDQFRLQQLWHKWPDMSDAERDVLRQELLLNLHKQVGGLQDSLDTSRYHLLKRPTNRDTGNIAEAGLGVFKLVVALMLMQDVTAVDFEEAWRSVNERVMSKWKWELDQLDQVNVLFCDIDGCVARYVHGFKKWAARRGYDISGPHINTPELEPIKDEFHSSGGFRELDPMDGAVSTLNAWRKAEENRRLIMVTARPFKQFRRIFKDTDQWLKVHGLMFDHLMFERDKAEAVRQVQPANIVGHIEDRGKHALEVAATGVKVYKLPFESHEEEIKHPLIIPVKDWREISNIFGVL